MTLSETAPARQRLLDDPETGGTLIIDLNAIEENFRTLTRLLLTSECAAVVKANAYGLGLEPVTAKLANAGCRTFFVADIAEARLKRLAERFGDRLYVELQRHGLESERAVEEALVGLAYDGALPLVATNEPYFAAANDFEAHDALLCIAEGALVATPERRRLTPEHRFKTRAEMKALFADLPEATDNSVEIALRCAYRPLTHKPILPRFAVAGGEAVGVHAQTHRASRLTPLKAGFD